MTGERAELDLYLTNALAMLLPQWGRLLSERDLHYLHICTGCGAFMMKHDRIEICPFCATKLTVYGSFDTPNGAPRLDVVFPGEMYAS